MKFFKGFVIFICVGGIFASFDNYYSTEHPGYLVLIAVLVVIAFFTIKNFNKVKKKDKKEKFILENELGKKDFNISKLLNLSNGTKFAIDDINKKLAINIGRDIQIYNYDDLLDFELNEDGETITRGKGLATAVGGITFGVIGALVGASGKRKNKALCNSMIVRLLINDLEEPEIRLPFIQSSTKKNSIVYKTALNSANELTATLTYIESNSSARH